MRILIFNWKDHTHPRSGGAEYVTHQYAKYLVQTGHRVTLFTSCYNDKLSIQSIDGVKIIRKGNWVTVYIYAFWNYLRELRHDTDIVIDQVHGIPFFTPLYVKKPILTWIHEVAGEIWKYEWPHVSWFGRMVEHMYIHMYRHIPFLTDSRSTKSELTTYGISADKISIIPLTIDTPQFSSPQKTKTAQLIYIGRLSAMKRVELLLRSLVTIQAVFPDVKTKIVGTGHVHHIGKLKQLANQLGLQQVEFLGLVTEKKKYELLSSSWLHIHPSVKEGFGLTVLEAASAGTPTIAFDVPGLRDQINTGKNGVLLQIHSPERLAKTIIELLQNKTKLKKLSISSMSWSTTLPSWKTQSKKLESLLQRVIKKSC